VVQQIIDMPTALDDDLVGVQYDRCKLRFVVLTLPPTSPLFGADAHATGDSIDGDTPDDESSQIGFDRAERGTMATPRADEAVASASASAANSDDERTDTPRTAAARASRSAITAAPTRTWIELPTSMASALVSFHAHMGAFVASEVLDLLVRVARVRAVSFSLRAVAIRAPDHERNDRGRRDAHAADDGDDGAGAGATGVVRCAVALLEVGVHACLVC
jgi:hypothetical protein